MFQVEVLKRAIRQDSEDESVISAVSTVLTDFVETMLEPLIKRYSLYSAKGSTIAKFAHNADQTMLTHILNGLLPTLNFVREAHKRDYLEKLGVAELKVYVLAYTMHDLDKILGYSLNTKTTVSTSEVRARLVAELKSLGAANFMADFEVWAADILWLAVNTQRQHGINLSHATFTTNSNSVVAEADTTIISEAVVQSFEAARSHSHLPTRVGPILRDLCTVSDVISFTIKSPEEAVYNYAATRGEGLLDIMGRYTDNQFGFVYHKIADVRGFLSNLVNNATMFYLSELYNKQNGQLPRLIPFLFFPNGVVYLDCQNRLPAPTVNREQLNSVVKAEIQMACQEAIEEGGGFGFSPLGLLKYPLYFHDFLKPTQFLELFARKTLSDSKVNIAESTLVKMKEMQTAGRVPVQIKLDYVPNERISMLGRFFNNYLRLIDENLAKGSLQIKTELEKRLIARLGEERWAESKLIPSSGGLDYRFYWLAAQYLTAHKGMAVYKAENPQSSLEALFEELNEELLELAGPQLETAPALQGPYMLHMDDYLNRNLFFGSKMLPQTPAVPISEQTLPDFRAELNRYTDSKKSGSSPLVCTLCNSAYPTAMQEDAAVLFQPWVYKNRLPLYKGSNAGGICSLCSLELMLRQILLKDRLDGGRIRFTGKKYEALELKYFFIYPDFFFTTQTARLASALIERMDNLKLFELRKKIGTKDWISTSDILDLPFFNPRPGTFNNFDDEELEKREATESKGSMYLAERNAEKQYPGFIFFAKKTFKADSGASAATASWVEAAWLGLALPLVLGARVVVTETLLPLYNSCADFVETVVLDAPHQAVRYMLPSPSARLRLDELFGPSPRAFKENRVSGSLASFSRAIEMHLDTEAGNADTKLSRFNRIARDLATDKLWVFSFLQEYVRENKLDSMPGEKAHHYNQIYQQLLRIDRELLPQEGENQSMTATETRHEQAVKLYLEFYSPFNWQKTQKYPSSRAIVQPIDIAAKRIIIDTLNLTEAEIKLEMRQELRAWLDRINKGLATGFASISKDTDLKIKEFVDFFYEQVFCGYAEGQRSLLNSRLNRFKNGCEAAFSDLMRERRAKREAENKPTTDLPDASQPTDEEA